MTPAAPGVWSEQDPGQEPELVGCGQVCRARYAGIYFPVGGTTATTGSAWLTAPFSIRTVHKMRLTQCERNKPHQCNPEQHTTQGRNTQWVHSVQSHPLRRTGVSRKEKKVAEICANGPMHCDLMVTDMNGEPGSTFAQYDPSCFCAGRGL